MNTPTKETMTKYLHLQYWNKYLLERGAITRKEYLQMAEKIRRRYPVV